jgi:hypothetical protein
MYIKTVDRFGAIKPLETQIFIALFSNGGVVNNYIIDCSESGLALEAKHYGDDNLVLEDDPVRALAEAMENYFLKNEIFEKTFITMDISYIIKVKYKIPVKSIVTYWFME